MAVYPIRTYGDSVLTEKTLEVEEIDAKIARLAENMIETMHAEPGSDLAANQVGVQKRVFVYDIGEDPSVVVNPSIVETDGEWTYEEGCLSVPGLSWPIVRPNSVHLVGRDLDGNEVSVEADTLLGRVFQHEMDHLDGILLLEHLEDDQRREALKTLRLRAMSNLSIMR